MVLSRTSVSLLPVHILTVIMPRAEEAMSTIYKATFVSLHVRKSNKAAIALYCDSLGFRVAKVEEKYCASRSSTAV
jgi:ribosomal protein S18 acetylase RimI-like enzyme